MSEEQKVTLLWWLILLVSKNCLHDIILLHFSECRDALLPLLIDQLSGQLDDKSNKPDHEACAQLLSNMLEVLDRKNVVSMGLALFIFSGV